MTTENYPNQAELDAFIQRAGFKHGWSELESWARRMAERAVIELASRPAPATVGEIGGLEAVAVARYKVVPAHSSLFWSHAVVAGDGTQQLYTGREVECQNMAAKFTGAFLDGAFLALRPAAADVPAVEQELLTIRKPRTRQEAEWLLRLGTLLTADVNRMLDEAFPGITTPPAKAPAQEHEAAKEDKRVTKEWCMRMAKIEVESGADMEVGAPAEAGSGQGGDVDYILALAEHYKDSPVPEIRAHHARLNAVARALAATACEAVAASEDGEALLVDAERYRYLRNVAEPNRKGNQPWVTTCDKKSHMWAFGGALDSHIDAAIAAARKAGKP